MKILLVFTLILTSFFGFSMNCEGDTIAPIAKIVALSTASLNKPYAELYAADFTFQSTDNCTEALELKFTFFNTSPVITKLNVVHYFKGNGLEASEEEFNLGLAQQWQPDFKTSFIRIFKCHFESAVNLRINVLDEQNNVGFGFCTLSLQDPQNLAGSCNEIIINVTNYKGLGLDGIEAKVKSMPDNIEKTYTFNKTIKIPIDPAMVCITIETAIQSPITGLSTSDIRLTRNHMLGIKKFKSPLSVIAADLDKDAKLDANDLTLFKKYYFGLSGSPGDSWVYFPSNDVDFCGEVDINKSLIFEVTGVQLGKVSLLEGQ